MIKSSTRVTNNQVNKQKLKDLLAISHHYGSDPEFLLAGGGNSSFKTEKHLYIKASGVSLSDIGEGGFDAGGKKVRFKFIKPLGCVRVSVEPRAW